MTPARTLDLAHLPDSAMGSRTPIWWGQVLMMTIESTILALLLAAYFYVRLGFQSWPPPEIGRLDLGWATGATLMLLASCIPMYLSGKAVEKQQFGRTRVWMALNIVMALAFLGMRAIELQRLNFKWTTNIYGSFVWIILGLHTLHAIADTVESLVVMTILLRGPVGAKQQLACKLDGLYWYWVAGVWLPFYILIYLYPALT